jgi:hypothetical protein
MSKVRVVAHGVVLQLFIVCRVGRLGPPSPQVSG